MLYKKHIKPVKNLVPVIIKNALCEMFMKREI